MLTEMGHCQVIRCQLEISFLASQYFEYGVLERTLPSYIDKSNTLILKKSFLLKIADDSLAAVFCFCFDFALQIGISQKLVLQTTYQVGRKPVIETVTDQRLLQIRFKTIKQGHRRKMQALCNHVQSDHIIHLLKNPTKIARGDTKNGCEVGRLPGSIQIADFDFIVEASYYFFSYDF